MAISIRQLRWLVLLGFAGSFQAHAISYEFGDITGSFDTRLSLGATVRTQDPDPKNYGIANFYEGERGTARSVNGDDGNLVWDAGDVTSAVAASSHELVANWENFAFFTRFRFAYDFKARGSSSPLGPKGESREGRVNDLLDLFVQGRFRVFDRSLRIRVGRQVVSWGESTFIQNGINVINAIDVSALRSPGSRLRDALIPSPMAHVSYTLTRNLSMEALYIADFDEIEIDPRYAYFSTNDFAPIDGDKAFLGLGRRADDNRAPIPVASGDGEAQLWFDREYVDRPEGDQQYGIAFRYFAPALNSTEFGIYYLNYDSRLPIFSTRKGAPVAYANAAGDRAPLGAQTGTYIIEYPENVDLFGLSFNTLGPFGVALQGEYSYRPNLPLQLAAIDVFLQALDASPLAGPDAANIANNLADTRGGYVQNGEIVQGYERVDAHQWQMTATQSFGPTFGASQFVMLGEVGVNYLDLPDGFIFNGPGVSLPAPGGGEQTPGFPGTALSGGSTQPGGFATSTSWGYRILGRFDYDNLVGAVTASPRLAFSHDVNGVGPNFTEEQMAVTVGLGFNYLQDWGVDISYTSYFGGEVFRGEDPAPAADGQPQTWATHANGNIDRDFVSASVSYSF
ncbi:DUF1302 domain-containing protein [Algiphilus sp.]|uniref:DUF1302 domain-containing protein n=1 Tax=Algiphilus sp. TaxID=1872431 RepID=UPI0025C47358|nr:DUF1302 domain-containing protein [Algiphilus sp.]MCK5770530.1 DUF1302 domain-containing protein [Algiphilus sp.]